MSDVLQADIFFFIASIATVVFLLLIAVILFQVYKVVKIIRKVLERVDAASEVVAEDAAHIRQLITNGGFFASLFGLMSSVKRRRKRRDEED